MTIKTAFLGASDEVLYREATGATLPAWVWRELHTTRSAAGDNRAGVLLVREGDEIIAMLPKKDLDRLITAAQEGDTRS